MKAIYYAVLDKDNYEIFDEMKFAVKYKPKFIISKASKGIHKTKFPQRTVEDEHFIINFYNSSGSWNELEKNEWKVRRLIDPVRYGIVLQIYVRDPYGKVRIFDTYNVNDHNKAGLHYGNRFFNNIESLVEFYYFFDKLASYKDWNEVEDLLKRKDENLAAEIAKVFSW